MIETSIDSFLTYLYALLTWSIGVKLPLVMNTLIFFTHANLEMSHLSNRATANVSISQMIALLDHVCENAASGHMLFERKDSCELFSLSRAH